MKKLLVTVLEYLTHKSTWAGIVVMLGTFGVQQIAGVQLSTVVDGLALVASGLLVFVAEKDKDNTDKVEAMLK